MKVHRNIINFESCEQNQTSTLYIFGNLRNFMCYNTNRIQMQSFTSPFSFHFLLWGSFMIRVSKNNVQFKKILKLNFGIFYLSNYKGLLYANE